MDADDAIRQLQQEIGGVNRELAGEDIGRAPSTSPKRARITSVIIIALILIFSAILFLRIMSPTGYTIANETAANQTELGQEFQVQDIIPEAMLEQDMPSESTALENMTNGTAKDETANETGTMPHDAVNETEETEGIDIAIHLISPADGSNTTRNITFEYNVSSTENIDNCTLYILYRYLQEEFSAAATTNHIDQGNNTFRIENIQPGEYIWKIGCENATARKWSETAAFIAQENITITNATQETTANETNITTTNITNTTSLPEEIVQGSATVGMPVSWTKRILVNQTGQVTVTTRLPGEATNIEVYEVSEETTRATDDFSITAVNASQGQEEGQTAAITGYSVARTGGKGMLTRFLDLLSQFFSTTGAAVLGAERVGLARPEDNATVGRNFNIIYETSKDFDECVVYLDGAKHKTDILVLEGLNFFDMRGIELGRHTWQIGCKLNMHETLSETRSFTAERNEAEEEANESEVRTQYNGEFIELNITGTLSEPTTYEIAYTTPGPEKQETVHDQYLKTVTISSSINYTNITAYTGLPWVPAWMVKLSHRINESHSEPVEEFTLIDSNNDTLMDGVEWTVPHLSNQSYDVNLSYEITQINITNAERRDLSHGYEANVTAPVNASDGDFTAINRKLLHAEFQGNLTQNDTVTVYAWSNKDEEMQLLEENSSEVLSTIMLQKNEWGWYNLTLGNTSLNHTMFDIKADCNVKYDYVTAYDKRAIIPKRVILPENLTIVLAENESINPAETPQTVPKDVIVKDTSGKPIAGFRVDFQNAEQDINLSSLLARTNAAGRKAVMHMGSWPTEIGSNKTLYIPSTGRGLVYVCPNANSIEEVGEACAGRFYARMGVNNITVMLNETDNETQTITVSEVDANGTYFYKVSGLTGTGGGESITILNVQSFPTLGGNWTVMFNTTGMANLTITGINGTTWSELLTDSNSTADDLEFLELRCGEESLHNRLMVIGWNGTSYNYTELAENDSIAAESLSIGDYSCDTTGYLTNKELNGGHHYLLFQFGDQNATAENYVSQLSCSMTTKASCSDTHVLYLSSQFNAHAELNNQSNYDYTVCCKEQYGETLGTNCSATGAEPILRLYDQNNSQIAKETYSAYGYEVCLSPSTYYNISCVYATDCTGYDTCVASISSTESAGDSNLHIGNCTGSESYATKICCGTQETRNPPSIASLTLNATSIYNYTTDNLTAWPSGISDPENDAVKLVYNWYRNGTSIAVLNLLMSQDANHSSSDGQTVYDVSGYGNNGRLGGATAGDSAEPTFNRDSGYDGFGAYYFNGSNYIDSGTGSSLTIGAYEDFALESWIRYTDSGLRSVYGYADTSTAGIWQTSLSGQIYCRVSLGTGSYVDAVTPATYNDGSWHHVVCVGDRNVNVSVYVDGVLRNTNSISAYEAGSFGNSRYIGGYPLGGINFTGNISELKLYNATLTAAQVQAQYYSGTGRYNLTDSSMTGEAGEWWNVSATPIDSWGMNGSKVWSNNVTIRTEVCTDNDGDGAYSTTSDPTCPGYRDCDDNNATLLPPRDELLVKNNTVLCEGTFYLNDSEGLGLVKFSASSVNLTCNGTVMVGNNSGAGLADSYSNTTAKDCVFSNYSFGGFVGGLWNRTLVWNSTGDDVGQSVATDSADNVVVGGTWRNGGQYDWSLAKYSFNGTQLWNRTLVWNATGDEYAYGVDVDSSDNIVVVGNWRNGSYSAWGLAKYDGNGNQLWNGTMVWNATSTNDYASGVDTDSSDNILISGVWRSGSYQRWGLAKYDGNGNRLWNRTLVWNSTSNEVAYSVAVDSEDNAILVGYWVNGGSSDWGLAKYDGNGNQLWNRTLVWNATGSEIAYDVAVDSSDNILITGTVRRNAQNDWGLAKYNSSGDQWWNRTMVWNSATDDGASSVAADSQGDAVVTGYWTSGAQWDWAVAKYSPSGTQLWNTSLNWSSGNDQAYQVCIDSSDSIVLTGFIIAGAQVDSALLKMNGVGGFRTQDDVFVNDTFANSTRGVEFGGFVRNTTLRNSTFSGNAYGAYIYSEPVGNLFYYNNFTASSVYHAYSLNAGNYFNTTNGSSCGALCARGNYWDDIMSLKIYDSNSDGFGDSGRQYPYNSTSSSKVNVNVTDWGPITSKVNVAPTVSNVVLNSTYGTNFTNENLTVWYNASDANGDTVKNVTTWYVNSIPIIALNMPFEATGGNESAWTKDYSNLSNHGTVSGATWNATGGYDGWGAYYYDGDDYITIADGKVPETISNISISVWFKTTSTLQRFLVSKDYDGANVPYTLSIQNASQAGGAGCSVGFGLYNGAAWYCSGITAGFTDGNWHHAVGEYNGTALLLYIDGSLVSSYPYGGAAVQNNANLYIGRYQGVYALGTIDDVRIYNRSLTADQILLLYQNNTDKIHFNETSVGEVWRACVTPNDGILDGAENCSNTLTIEEEYVGCMDITSSGTYTLTTNAAGAPLTVATEEVQKACIAIYSDNVTFSCNGYNITNTGVTNAAAIIVPSADSPRTTNVTIKDCEHLSGYKKGVYFHKSENNILRNVTAHGNTDGVYVYSALETNVTNVTSYNNTQYGFQFDKSTGIKLWNTTAYNNSVAGYLIGRESGVTLYETTQTYTNKHDYEVNNTAGSSATTANLTQARLRSPAGPYSNATVVTLSDNAGPGDAYTLNWTTNSTAIPTDLDSFESKWVNISPIGASLPTIDRFLIHWDESETTDYFEDRLEFWKYSTQMGWSMLNNTPNTTTNEMSLASFYPTSDYGIVENKTNRAPTIAATILNATDDPLNRTNANLTSWVTGISDQDNDDVKLFYNWYINETSITVLNLLMSTDADYIADQQTVIDISGHENNATLGSPAAGDSAEPAFDKKGTYQGYGAYDFDGSDDYMNVSDDNTLDFNANSFSVEVWVKSDGAANPGGDEGIIYKRDASTGYNIYFDSSGMVNLYYRNSSTIRTAQYATDVYDDDWHHVVVTRSVEQDNISLYVDGVWRDDDLGVASGMANSADLIIGSQSVGAGQNLDGTISDTLIYNLTLTPEQVRHNFDSGIGRHNITVSTHTKKHDWWNFSVTPVDRRGKKGDKLHSNKVLIMNTPPLNSTLQAPNNGNDTLMTRFPTLNWTNVTDDDEDYVSFKLNITHETCGSIVYTGITDLNKTPDIELHTYDPDEGCTGWYNWTVEGYDGEEYGLPSAKWGFKVMPIIILSLENTVVDFGNMIPGESDNTSDNDPLPFLVENLGTVVSDIINSTADSSLWIREPSPTENFQLKVSDNETGSINLSGSATSWTDIGLSNITIIDSLNYSDANDRVKIDVRIDVPADEPPGQKSVNITFYGAQT